MLTVCVVSQIGQLGVTLYEYTVAPYVDRFPAWCLPKQMLSLKVGVLASCSLLSQGQLQGVYQHTVTL